MAIVRIVVAAVIALMLASPLARAEQQVVEVVTLGYHQANDVIPTLRPLLAPGGTLTGMTNRLVIKTTPSNLAELKQVLAQLDSRPRQLLISVRQSSTASGTADEASVSGRIGVGDHAEVSTSKPAGEAGSNVSVQTDNARVEGRIVSSRSARDDAVTQTVQVLEGNSAFIRIGQSAPMTTRQVTRGAGVRRIDRNTEMVEADTGFYVTPRVSGDRVTLEIATARDQLRKRGTVDVQQASTVVSGRLGDWIEIAGSSTTVEQGSSAITTRSRSASDEQRAVMLKVDEVR